MASFGAVARRLTIEPHPDPKTEALECARVDDFRAVVKKGEFSTGDLAVYIQEGSIVPDDIIEEMGLTGRLAGGTLDENGIKKSNQVKAVRLRGALSQGLVYVPNGRVSGPLQEGADYAEELGIVKFIPPIPDELAGEVAHAPGLLRYTEIENIKAYPNALLDGEEVVATEKLHGICTVFALVGGELIVSSKGLAKQELGLLESDDNAYWRVARQIDIKHKLVSLASRAGLGGRSASVHLYGETLGVQDLKYGSTAERLSFRAFDLRIDDRFLDYDEAVEALAAVDVPMVPCLYRGPFDRDAIEKVATGKESVTGTEAHVREGVVVRPVHDRIEGRLGRVVLKVISPNYLLRKGATEFE